MDNIKISVVTVCRNAEDVIEKTIQSVISQTYSNLEYIVIDGASTDGTKDIIKKYVDEFSIKYISENDTGTYDAMNKGITFATGDYIQFLNAGDYFCNDTVLQDTVSIINNNRADVFYGNIKYMYPNGNVSERSYGKWCGKKIYFLTGDCINHQAMFASAELLKKRNYNINYKVDADREWMMWAMKNGATFKHMGIPVCYYSLDIKSVSIQNEELHWNEAKQLIKSYYPMGYPIYCVFDFLRNNQYLSGLLHRVYELIYIKK